MAISTPLLGKWLSESEAAAKLRKTVRTLQAWRRQGKGPRYSRNGKEVVYTDKALDDYLVANEKHPTRESA
jgi:hypothetical protein